MHMVILWLGVRKVGDLVKVCFLSGTFLPSSRFFYFTDSHLCFIIAEENQSFQNIDKNQKS